MDATVGLVGLSFHMQTFPAVPCQAAQGEGEIDAVHIGSLGANRLSLVQHLLRYNESKHVVVVVAVVLNDRETRQTLLVSLHSNVVGLQ